MSELDSLIWKIFSSCLILFGGILIYLNKSEIPIVIVAVGVLLGGVAGLFFSIGFVTAAIITGSIAAGFFVGGLTYLIFTM